MKKDNRHLGLVVPDELLRKLHFVSDYYGRSNSRHILYLIRQSVDEFEKEHGKIALPDIDE